MATVCNPHAHALATVTVCKFCVIEGDFSRTLLR